MGGGGLSAVRPRGQGGGIRTASTELDARYLINAPNRKPGRAVSPGTHRTGAPGSEGTGGCGPTRPGQLQPRSAAEITPALPQGPAAGYRADQQQGLGTAGDTEVLRERTRTWTCPRSGGGMASGGG